MSTDLDAQIADLNRRREAAQRDRVRAEAASEAAIARAEAARAALAAEFGVTDVASATTRRAELHAELVTTVNELRAALDAIDA